MKRIVLFASLIFFNIDTGRAASFDCNKATTDNEIMICMDQWLSKLDEDYARLYGITRDAFTVTVNTKQRFLQNQARVALREREKKCKDRACLVNWYDRGRTRLHGHLWHEAPHTLKTEVTPQLLYSKLNLRSFAKNLNGFVV